MTSQLDEKIRTTLESMVAEAPIPAEFDRLATVTAEASVGRRRWYPVAVMAATFAMVVAVIGAISLVGLPSSDPAGGVSTIFVAADDVPADLVLRAGEVWADGAATTQIYVDADAAHYGEDVRTASINMQDAVAIAEQQGMLTDDALDTINNPQAYFADLMATLEDVYGGEELIFEETLVRDRQSLVMERTTTSTQGDLVLEVGVLTAEGNGIYSEIGTHNLTRQEALAIAESLHPISPDSFPELSWPQVP